MHTSSRKNAAAASWWTRLRAATILGGVATAVFAGALTAPAAEAATAEQCFDGTFNGSLKINHRHDFDDHIGYGATYHWCAVDGQVTTFVVDTTYGEDAGVIVDIRPLHPLRWAPTYPIFVNASSGKNFSHKEVTLTAGGDAIPRR